MAQFSAFTERLYAGDADCQALTEALQVRHITPQRRRTGELSALSEFPVRLGQLKEQELVFLAVNDNPDVSAACGGSHWCRPLAIALHTAS